MPQTLAPPGAVELAVVERSGLIESRHTGAAVLLAPDGTIIDRWGDASSVVLPRSAAKPLQALACLTAGAALEGEHLAIAMASHSGTDRHATLVRGILDAAGLGEDALRCPAAWPADEAARHELIRELGSPSRIRMSCSGTHAAMLAACVANGWDPASYLDPQHPLQAHLTEVTERLTGEKVANVVDGCGAPGHALTLFGLARAIHRIGTSSSTSPFALHRSAGVLVRAVRENAWAVAGPGSPESVVIDRLGVFAKSGAEGVLVMVAPDGATVALKMLDGSGRAATVVALALLVRAGALDRRSVAETLAELPLTVLGGGAPVGTIRPTLS